MITKCTNVNNPKFKKVRRVLLERPWASDREVSSRIPTIGNTAYYTKGVREAIGITRTYEPGPAGRKRWVTIVDKVEYNKARRKSHLDTIEEWKKIAGPIGVSIYWTDERSPYIPPKVPQVTAPLRIRTMPELLRQIVFLMGKQNITSLTINQDGNIKRTMKRVVVDEFTIAS